jgi:ribosomal protein L7Ae-like RNA K-turn-binding protein
MNEISEKKDKLIIGKKQVIRGITENKFCKILLASDNDLHFNDEIINKCNLHGVYYEISSSKKELSEFCNIQVPCGVIGIEKQ